jgi:hypothetical protein
VIEITAIAFMNWYQIARASTVFEQVAEHHEAENNFVFLQISPQVVDHAV